jgi:hypothetical protein
MVLVTSTGVLPATLMASILWFIGHGRSGVLVRVALNITLADPNFACATAVPILGAEPRGQQPVNVGSSGMVRVRDCQGSSDCLMDQK